MPQKDKQKIKSKSRLQDHKRFINLSQVLRYKQKLPIKKITRKIYMEANRDLLYYLLCLVLTSRLHILHKHPTDKMTIVLSRVRLRPRISKQNKQTNQAICWEKSNKNLKTVGSKRNFLSRVRSNRMITSKRMRLILCSEIIRLRHLGNH